MSVGEIPISETGWRAPEPVLRCGPALLGIRTDCTYLLYFPQVAAITNNRTDKKQVSALAGGPDASPREARNSSLYAPKIATAPGRPARMKITVRFKISFPRSFSG